MMEGEFWSDRQTVQYFGKSGYTEPCLQAVNAILNSGILPKTVTIVSEHRVTRQARQDHLFIFWDWGYIPVVIVPSGFSSGYPGEGPKGYALAICMIREKQIPIDWITVNSRDFNSLDKGLIQYEDDPLIMDIKAKTEGLTWPWYEWVPENLEEALERGQLWRHAYLQSYQADPITIAISNIDLISPDTGNKLRLARGKVFNGIQTEEWQHAGQLVQDAWIELSQRLCDLNNIDTSDIEKDKVVPRLQKLELEEKVFNLAKASFDLNNMVRHDREITQEVAISCVVSSIFSMQSFILKYIDSNKRFK